MPPSPVPKAVTSVPVVTPGPNTVAPTTIAPESNPLTVLPPMATFERPLILPGLLSGLGLTDYEQSIADGLTESYEAFCIRISGSPS